MGCAVGACLGCVVMGSNGVPQRVCREGPVFGSERSGLGRLVEPGAGGGRGNALKRGGSGGGHHRA